MKNLEEMGRKESKINENLNLGAFRSNPKTTNDCCNQAKGDLNKKNVKCLFVDGLHN